MSEELLSLPVGAPLQMQAADDADAPRYAVRFIGYLPGGSLIVRTPEVGGKPIFVRAGQTYNLRLLRGDSVVGFVVPVLLVASHPYPHLHLGCPTDVDRIVVRNARRVNADVLATARNTTQGPDAEHHPVTIIDLSTTGAKLAADVPLGEVGETLQLNFEIDVAGKPEKIVTLGIIRNVGEREGPAGLEEQVYGLQFKAINRYQQVLIHSWVLQQVTAEERLV